MPLPGNAEVIAATPAAMLTATVEHVIDQQAPPAATAPAFAEEFTSRRCTRRPVRVRENGLAVRRDHGQDAQSAPRWACWSQRADARHNRDAKDHFSVSSTTDRERIGRQDGEAGEAREALVIRRMREGIGRPATRRLVSVKNRMQSRSTK